MDIMKEMDKLAGTLAELVEKDKNYARVKEFVKNCDDENFKRQWNSLSEEEKRAVSDELYHHTRCSSNSVRQ